MKRCSEGLLMLRKEKSEEGFGKENLGKNSSQYDDKVQVMKTEGQENQTIRKDLSSELEIRRRELCLANIKRMRREITKMLEQLIWCMLKVPYDH